MIGPSQSCLGEGYLLLWSPVSIIHPHSRGHKASRPVPQAVTVAIPPGQDPARQLWPPSVGLVTNSERGSSCLTLSSGPSSGSFLARNFFQTNQASQQTGDQNNKEQLRNSDSGKEATLSFSRTGGVEIGPGLWVRACLARTIFVLSRGWGLMKSQLHFTKTLSP